MAFSRIVVLYLGSEIFLKNEIWLVYSKFQGLSIEPKIRILKDPQRVKNIFWSRKPLFYVDFRDIEISTLKWGIVLVLFYFILVSISMFAQIFVDLLAGWLPSYKTCPYLFVGLKFAVLFYFNYFSISKNNNTPDLILIK